MPVCLTGTVRPNFLDGLHVYAIFIMNICFSLHFITALFFVVGLISSAESCWAEAKAEPLKILKLSVNTTAKNLKSLERIRAYRLLDSALSELGYKIELDYVPPKRAIQQVHQGYSDGLFLRVAGVERQHANIIKVPSVAHNMRIYTYASKNNFPASGALKDLGVGSVALLRGIYPPEHYLPGWLLEREKVWVTTFENGAKMAAAGRVKVVVLPELIFNSIKFSDPDVAEKLRPIRSEVVSIPNYCFLNIKYKKLIPKLASIMERLKSEDPFQFDDAIFPSVLTDKDISLISTGIQL